MLFFVKVTAALGAEQFYTLENNLARSEPIELARELDDKCSKAWIGHPYVDVIDNNTIFDIKITRALQVIFLNSNFYINHNFNIRHKILQGGL